MQNIGILVPVSRQNH